MPLHSKPAAQDSLIRSFTKVRFSIISCRWKRSTVNSTRITSRPTQTASPPSHIISALPELQFPRNRTITCQKPSISFELPLPIERYIYAPGHLDCRLSKTKGTQFAPEEPAEGHTVGSRGRPKPSRKYWGCISGWAARYVLDYCT
jgi:hypothetical protein